MVSTFIDSMLFQKGSNTCTKAKLLGGDSGQREKSETHRKRRHPNVFVEDGRFGHITLGSRPSLGASHHLDCRGAAMANAATLTRRTSDRSGEAASTRPKVSKSNITALTALPP